MTDFAFAEPPISPTSAKAWSRNKPGQGQTAQADLDAIASGDPRSTGHVRSSGCPRRVGLALPLSLINGRASPTLRENAIPHAMIPFTTSPCTSVNRKSRPL